MSENMASSTSLGSRPSLSQISSYSASVRPSSRWRPAIASGVNEPGDMLADRLEELEAVARARQRVDGVLGVGHEAEDVARRVDHAGDVVERAVGVLPWGVTEHDLLARRDLLEQLGRGVPAPRGVLDRDREGVSLRARARERRAGVDHRDVDLAADEAQPGVGQQGTGQEPGLAQDLEAVADAEDQAALAGEAGHRLHDRREAGHRAHAEV